MEHNKFNIGNLVLISNIYYKVLLNLCNFTILNISMMMKINNFNNDKSCFINPVSRYKLCIYLSYQLEDNS